MKTNIIHSLKPQFRRIGLFIILIILSTLVAACGAADSYSVAPAVEEVMVEREAAAEPLPAAAFDSSAEFADGNAVPLETYLANAVTQAQDTTRVIIYTGRYLAGGQRYPRSNG